MVNWPTWSRIFSRSCVGQVLDLLGISNAACFADLASAGATDAEDGGQANFGMLMRRNVDASDTCHVRPLKLLQSTLALLVTRIGTDHAHNALAPDDFAVAANFLDRSRNFHLILLKLCLIPSENSTAKPRLYHNLLCPEHNPRPTQVVGRQLNRDLVTREDADVVHPHLSRNMPENHMPVFQLDPEGVAFGRFSPPHPALNDIVL
jgi:hypothetical protein